VTRTIPYYGGKMRLAPRLAAFFAPHTSYVEPFAGSAAVMFAKERVRWEIINDLDGDVTNFWRVLRDHGDELIRVLQMTPYGREEYTASLEPTEDPMERARRFAVRSFMSFNVAQSRGYGPCSPRPQSSRARGFVRAVDQALPVLVERLRGVEVEQVDALRLISRWDYPDTALYVDPPYLASTRSAPDRYAVESNDDEYHTRLLKSLDAFSGQVVLSGYRSPVYDQFLDPDRWALHTVSMNAPTTYGRGRSARREECIWVKAADRAQI